ncbi:tetratricopeptide repeat protein, partial [Chondromyces apiculatus]|uniref:tetratricopeptide repeat protein n=1 Tax=Chondromyces apiculatus TaxID=51 RepID=UPI0005C59045
MPPQLTVEVSGCAAVRAGPVCEAGEGDALRVWIRAPEQATIGLAFDGQPVALPAGVPVQGGARFSVGVPAKARALQVTAAVGGAVASFEHALGRREVPAALDEAEALRREGKLDEAEARLGRVVDDAQPGVQAEVRGKRARIARSRGRTEEAVALFREAVRLDREAGRVSDELKDRFAMAYTLLYQGRRFGEARAVLEGLDGLTVLDADGHAMVAYYQGLVAYETGDLRAALRLFRGSAEHASRLGLEAHRVDVMQPWATALSLLGRHAEAAALLGEAEAALGQEASPCRRAHLANDRGWVALRAEGAGVTGEAPIPHFERALALYQGGCAEAADVANVLTNLALAEVTRGDLAAASRAVTRAREVEPQADARIQVWWLLVEARVALGSGRAAAALETWERVARLAEGAVLRAAGMEAALGRAEALEALGRDAEARAAYLDAEARLDEVSLLVPLGEGRETFLSGHARGARLLVDFLLRQVDGAPEVVVEGAG